MPNTVAGSLFFTREELKNLKTDVQVLINASPNTFAVLSDAENEAYELFDCKILRAQVLRLENHCYSFGYFLYISIIMIGIYIGFCFLTIAVLLFSVGKDEEEKK